ncbi:MAG: hypothetical protein LH480_13280 [Rubrivivax sp.]|nr:hypothetical protein [Rubrivivax sp.]
MNLPLEPTTALLSVSLVYGLMALMVWALLARHHATHSVALWAGGCLLFCAGIALLALRQRLPPLPRVVGGNTLILTGLLMQAPRCATSRACPGQRCRGGWQRLG